MLRLACLFVCLLTVCIVCKVAAILTSYLPLCNLLLLSLYLSYFELMHSSIFARPGTSQYRGIIYLVFYIYY